MQPMNLISVSVERETGLRSEFQLETTGKNRFCYTLIAKFIGKYRPGSAGNPDAAYMVGMTDLALELWAPAALVVDLTELSYVWGDELELILPPREPDRAAIVVGPGCSEAIATLMWGIDTRKKAADADFVYDSVEEAWEAVRYCDDAIRG